MVIISDAASQSISAANIRTANRKIEPGLKLKPLYLPAIVSSHTRTSGDQRTRRISLHFHENKSNTNHKIERLGVRVKLSPLDSNSPS